MSETHAAGVVKWWAMVVTGTAAALLIAWLARISGVPLATVLSIGAGAAALGWLIVLVAVPWNLYFAARRVVGEMAVSRGRGIVVAPAQEDEALRIARRLLWFAVGGHVATAAGSAVITYFSGVTVGYYFTGSYLLSATIRPAAAYFSHLRERISALSRESVHPREDVMTLRAKMDGLAKTVKQLAEDLPAARQSAAGDLRQAESALAGDIAHTRQLLTTDLARITDAQAADRDAARTRDDDLGRRIDKIVRRIEETLDGMSDHQELQAGLRALVRMIRADAAAS